MYFLTLLISIVFNPVFVDVKPVFPLPQTRDDHTVPHITRDGNTSLLPRQSMIWKKDDLNLRFVDFEMKKKNRRPSLFPKSFGKLMYSQIVYPQSLSKLVVLKWGPTPILNNLGEELIYLQKNPKYPITADLVGN